MYSSGRSAIPKPAKAALRNASALLESNEPYTLIEAPRCPTKVQTRSCSSEREVGQARIVGEFSDTHQGGDHFFRRQIFALTPWREGSQWASDDQPFLLGRAIAVCLCHSLRSGLPRRLPSRRRLRGKRRELDTIAA